MAVEYVNTARNSGVVFAYDLSPRFQEKLPVLRLQGLDPAKKYLVREINLMPGRKSSFIQNEKILSGDYLMKVGLDMFSHRHNNSMVVELTAI